MPTLPKGLWVALGALASGMVAFSSPSALAQPRAPEEAASASPAPAPEVAVMDAELAVFATRGRHQRTALLISAGVSALLLVPAGVVLTRRADSQTVGIEMAIGGAVPLLPKLFSFRASGIERVRDAFEARRASGMPGSEVLRLTEADWERAASGAHGLRVVVGGVDLALGTACAAAGLFFLLSDPVAKLDRGFQTALGASLVSPGVSLVTLGIYGLLQESVEETSWDAHRATKALTSARTAPVAARGLGLAPLRGGIAAVVTYTF
jgi:hypothetical protein